MALTDAQMTDVRRFAGYQVTGTTQQITSTNDIVYLVYGMVQMSLYNRLTTLSVAEELILTSNYLVNLTKLEQDILGASANMDTEKASVWTWNRHEVSDRVSLYNKWRRDMCAFLGLRPGPALGDGTLALVRG